MTTNFKYDCFAVPAHDKPRAAAKTNITNVSYNRTQAAAQCVFGESPAETAAGGKMLHNGAPFQANPQYATRIDYKFRPRV